MTPWRRQVAAHERRMASWLPGEKCSPEHVGGHVIEPGLTDTGAGVTPEILEALAPRVGEDHTPPWAASAHIEREGPVVPLPGWCTIAECSSARLRAAPGDAVGGSDCGRSRSRTSPMMAVWSPSVRGR
jgi:hypothetical protein